MVFRDLLHITHTLRGSEGSSAGVNEQSDRTRRKLGSFCNSRPMRGSTDSQSSAFVCYRFRSRTPGRLTRPEEFLTKFAEVSGLHVGGRAWPAAKSMWP